MATTAKDTSHEKEKTRGPYSTTHHNDTTNGKRASKPFVAGSTTSKGLAILTEKPSPHYLKPTLSSTKDVCKKKQASDDTILKYSHSRRKSMEKPPSPSQLKRTLSASPKGIRFAASSPPPKKGISPKTVSERTPKTPTPTPKSGKAQPFTKPVSVKKNASPTTMPKKETKPSPTTYTPPSPDITETPFVKPEEEVKATPVQEVQEEKIESVEEEGIQAESSPLVEQSSIDSIDLELKNADSCGSSILSEEPDLVNKSPAEDIEGRSAGVVENECKPKDDEQVNNTEEIKNQDEVEVEVEVDEKAGETGEDENKETSNANVDSPGDAEEQGKQLDGAEVEDEGNQRLKLKERKEDAEINEEKAESENVVLKHQDVQGKKESPAYNDVIEETASKLVEKRKSKVKALVGAFETVINLENETQPTQGE